MDKKNGSQITEEEYHKLLERYGSASPELQDKIVLELTGYMFMTIKEMAYQRLMTSGKQIQPSSIANATCLRVLGYFQRNRRLEKYDTLESMLKLLSVAVKHTIIDKYDKLTRYDRGPKVGNEYSGVVSLDVEYDDKPALEVRDKHDDIEKYLEKDVADNMISIFRKILDPDDLQLLILRGLRELTFDEIITAQKMTCTADALRMRYRRLLQTLAEYSEVKRLIR